MIVLDASALLAFLFREPGAARVAEVLDDSCMSTVNLSEVLGRFSRDGHDPGPILGRLQATAIEFVAFSEREAAEAANLLPITRPLGLSLGDRACLALARARRLPVLTADSAWGELDIGIEIEVLLR